MKTSPFHFPHRSLLDKYLYLYIQSSITIIYTQIPGIDKHDFPDPPLFYDFANPPFSITI